MESTGYGEGKRYNAVAMFTQCSECGHVENGTRPEHADCECCADAVRWLDRMAREDLAAQYFIGVGHSRDETGRIEVPR